VIYLDNAATTLQKPASVYRAVERAMLTLASPGRGGYPAAMAAAEEAYRCRETAAALFGLSEPERVVFCQNATHGLNIAIQALARPGERVVISGYEHNAVLRPLRALEARIRVAAAPPFEPAAAAEAYHRELKQGAALAVVNHVSNVFGCIQPVEEIAALCGERGIPLIVDASQSAGVLPLRPEEWNAAFVAMPGHKGLYGPQGTGLLLVGRQPGDRRIRTLMEGGSGSSPREPDMPDWLPDRLEAGTHNMPGIAGLRAGLEFVKRLGPEAILAHEEKLVHLAAELLGENPRLRVFAAAEPFRQGGVLSFQVKEMDCETAAERLAERGFSLRAGLHCAPLAHDTAGTGKEGTVRMSVSAFSRESHVRRLAKALENL
jgi:cysteine desulfurase family protein